jgi:TetR/AcrR family transcriptional regulator, transcriptional repressor for nem operon
MPKRRADSRTRLVEAALGVTYRYGFETAALADIAEAAKVPLGNVYYYFKTKDGIAEAVLERRAERLKSLLEELDKTESPQERLCGFVDIKIRNREELAQQGCPVGTLCSELRKRGGPVANKATVLFAGAIQWMEEQFRAMGHARDAKGLAVHLLSATQGVSVLAHTFRDPELIDMEAARLKEWIRSLATPADSPT